MQELKKIKALLKKAKNAAIFFHVGPEGDCLGSALALKEILYNFGLRIKIFSTERISGDLIFFVGREKISQNKKDILPSDVAFVLDSSDLSRIGEFAGEVKKIPVIVNIDHHSDNSLFGNINLVKTAAATGELIYLLASYLKCKISRAMATNLYLALATDTGSFRFANTTADTFKIAGELVKKGAEVHKINQKVYENKSFIFLKVLGKLFFNARALKACQIVFSKLTYHQIKALKIKENELDDLVDYFKILGGVKVILLFREILPGLVKINLRSRDNFNVQKIAQKFGGGGHPLASGCQIKGNFKKIAEKVLREVKKYLK